jgi:Zn-finger nucleic acid-binding protein
MNRKNFGACSGVIIDWCRGHGYWFDTHELEQIMTFVGGGGLAKTRRRTEAEAKRQIKISEKRRKGAGAHIPGARSAGVGGLFGGRGTGGGLAEMGLAAILFGLLESIF